MKLRTRDLILFFALMLIALLTLPSLFNARRTTVKASAQSGQTGRSDVKATTKQKTAKPSIPSGAGPANDNCAAAITVSSCAYTNTQSTAGAGDETNEPQSTCTLQSNSVWYTLPANANLRTVTVDTCGSDFDTAIMVYQVNGAACDFAQFTAVACNDDTGGCGDGFQSSVSFLAAANTVYKIQVGGFDGETGSLTVNVNCEELLCDPLTVNGTLGTGSPDWPSTSGQQTPARLFRDGVPSSCASPKTCPGPFGSGSFTFDAYTFTNESSEDQCVTVQYRPNVGCGVNAHAIVYLNSFSPTALCTNYLADVGSSDDIDFTFTVPAGANFVVVIGANNPGGVGNGCAYQFTVVGNICQGFDYCVQDNNNPSRFILLNSETGAYEYHDCSKGIVLTGTGVISTAFCKIALTDKGPNPKRPDRNISVDINPCTLHAVASIKVNPTATTVNLTDSNITNNNCACPE
jgi:hypothetical protein